MALRIPTSKDLERLAEANHFQLNEQELEAFQALIPGMFESYEVLDQMREPKEPLKYRGRDPGQRPTRQEDPLNAIVRRCTLKGASWGKLAGKRFGPKKQYKRSRYAHGIRFAGVRGIRPRYRCYYRDLVAGRGRRDCGHPEPGKLCFLWRW